MTNTQTATVDTTTVDYAALYNLRQDLLQKYSVPNAATYKVIFNMAKFEQLSPYHIMVGNFVTHIQNGWAKVANNTAHVSMKSIKDHLNLCQQMFQMIPNTVALFTFTEGKQEVRYEGKKVQMSYLQFTPCKIDSVVTLTDEQLFADTVSRLNVKTMPTLASEVHKLSNEAIHELRKLFIAQSSNEVVKHLFVLELADKVYPVVASTLTEAITEFSETIVKK